MFTTALMIAIPLLFILVGALAALSFGRDPDAARPSAADTAADRPLLEPPALVLFQPQAPAAPRPGRERRPQPTAAELIAALEKHLQRESVVARGFSRDPSPQTLWVN